ncbi:MAG: hypothetical protein RIC55_02255 [Pirellulaceae bacterium]
MPAKKWTAERVIEAILERQRQGLPLLGIYDEATALSNAATRLFGSWRKALVAAGVSSAKPLQRWSKQLVIEQILARQQQGLALTKTQDRALYAAATRCFGGWRAALAAAGINSTLGPRRLWTRDRILDKIRKRAAQGLSLRAIYRLDPTLNTAAQRHFGGWYKAVDAAGVDVEPPTKWSRARLIAVIQDRHARGLPTTSTATDDHAFRSAVYKHFDSWDHLRQEAGIPHPARREWTRAGVVHEIQTGCPDSYRCSSLRYNAVRHFGSWHAALRAAGVQPDHRRWSPERVLHAIRAWRQRSANGYLSTEDRALAQAARRYFGSCEQALIAAGVTPKKSPKWTKRRIIEAIQDRVVRGLSLNSDGSALVQAARRYFGSWHAAVKAAGIEPPWPRRVRNSR